ncbi:MAG: mechanosensitive ion channel family protein [Planctomycetes bacterium]|nr:mechanosensitive ion channel family protein [Planctomycetota bacterium]
MRTARYLSLLFLSALCLLSAQPATGADEPTQNFTQLLTEQPTPVPSSLRSARATMTRFLTETNRSDYQKAAGCLDLSKVAEGVSYRDLAWKLKYVVDRLARVDLETISDDANSPPYRFWPDPQYPPIEINPTESGAWLFSTWTVKNLEDDLEEGPYQELFNKQPVAGMDPIRDFFPVALTQSGFLLPYYQWICLFIVVMLGLIVDRLVRHVLSRAMLAWLKLMKVKIDETAELGVWKPIGLLAMALVWYAGTVLIGLRPVVLDVLLVAVKFFAVVAAVWTGFRLIDLLASFLMKKAEKTRTKFDDLLIPLVSRSLKVFAVCIGLIVFAETFNLPLTGLISGLGIGGLAFALAAQDSLGNFFGSLTVLVDRPFEIGDWIVTGDIEGTVETVGMRSSRVRTFYNSLITVPNVNLTTAVVDNMGRRSYRRIKTMLGLQYDTPPEKIEAFCEGVRELIRRHPYTRKDYYHVYFNQFSASSLDVLLYCFIECPDWSVELRERQRLFIDILKLAQELGVEFAFPTRTVHLYQEETPPDDSPQSALDDPLLAGRRLAARVAGSPLPPSDRPGSVEYLGPLGDDVESDEG